MKIDSVTEELQALRSRENQKRSTVKRDDRRQKKTLVKLDKRLRTISVYLGWDLSEKEISRHKRIDILEDYKGKVVGMVSIISVLVSGGVAWIWKKITT